jgi:hypothetical protein
MNTAKEAAKGKRPRKRPRPRASRLAMSRCDALRWGNMPRHAEARRCLVDPPTRRAKADLLPLLPTQAGCTKMDGRWQGRGGGVRGLLWLWQCSARVASVFSAARCCARSRSQPGGFQENPAVFLVKPERFPQAHKR